MIKYFHTREQFCGLSFSIVLSWYQWQHIWGTCCFHPKYDFTYTVSKQSESILWYVCVGNNRWVAPIYCLNSCGMDVRAVVYGSFTANPCAICSLHSVFIYMVVLHRWDSIITHWQDWTGMILRRKCHLQYLMHLNHIFFTCPYYVMTWHGATTPAVGAHVWI